MVSFFGQFSAYTYCTLQRNVFTQQIYITARTIEKSWIYQPSSWQVCFLLKIKEYLHVSMIFLYNNPFSVSAICISSIGENATKAIGYIIIKLMTAYKTHNPPYRYCIEWTKQQQEAFRERRHLHVCDLWHLIFE